MDLERLQLRAKIIQDIRKFFIEKGYLELDTPALSESLIPETCLEVFTTNYVEPWSEKTHPLYLVPSPEVHIKKIIAQHKVSVFQLSKCYRNAESIGRIHNPEFTMLEYYTVGADYKDSAAITEELFNYILPPETTKEEDVYKHLRPPFIRLTMDEAFAQYAGFKLSCCQRAADLVQQARRLGIMEQQDNPFDQWGWDDLYELILVQCVEPKLPKEKPVLLMDYPAQVACLAQDVPSSTKTAMWKQRWELYVQGIELSNCYSEETDSEKIRLYFEQEGEQKNSKARIPHKIDNEYWKIFNNFPKCSGNAMGVDRLIALICGLKTIEPILP
ncbi:MAG: LysR family transcriptional regulator [Spirochaetaceae bacterium]|nr:LysR family transcriptional regulator [Spirochaetaceae bacterium]